MKGKWTALMYGARYGHVDVVAELAVKGGVVPDVGDPFCKSVQHIELFSETFALQ